MSHWEIRGKYVNYSKPSCDLHLSLKYKHHYTEEMKMPKDWGEA